MKARTSVLVICLATTLVSIGRAETVRDRAGKDWTCRDYDPKYNFYQNSGRFHFYDIKAAKDAGEAGHADDHFPICVDALAEGQIIWSWKGATKIQVTFNPITDDKKTGGPCWNSNQPFLQNPNDDSGNSASFASGKADDDHSGCAYELTFTSSAGTYDPHIIIKGSYTASLHELQEAKKLFEGQRKDLEVEVKKVNAKIGTQKGAEINLYLICKVITTVVVKLL
jgi:hypothetical protein